MLAKQARANAAKRVGNLVLVKPKKKPQIGNLVLVPEKKKAAKPAAKAPAAKPGKPTPSTPQTAVTPPVMPFETPEDLMAWAGEHQNVEDALWNVDSDLAQLTTNTNFQAGYDDSAGHHKGTIDADAEKAQAATVDNMLARGIGRSSIKDGELYDIATTAAIRKNFLTTALGTATLEASRRKKIIGDNWNLYQEGHNRQMAANAEEANALMPAPTPAQAATAAAAKKPAAKPKAKPPVGALVRVPDRKPKAPKAPKKPPRVGKLVRVPS